MAHWLNKRVNPGAAKDIQGEGFVVIGILITTIGILLLTIGILLLILGLVGASIEVYVQLLSAIRQQLPAILQPEGEGTTTGESGGPPFDSIDILTAVCSIVDPPTPHLLDISSVFPTELSVGRGSIILNTAVRSLIETVISTPLWLALTVVGIVLIYFGLYISQRQRPWRQP